MAINTRDCASSVTNWPGGHKKGLLMKIVRKSRKIKSRHIGLVNHIDNNDIYGRSPALEYMKLKVYFCDVRVYSDEIPLPDYQFLTNRSSYFLEKNDYLADFTSGMWHGMAMSKLKQIIHI